MKIRPMKADDKSEIMKAISDTGMFSPAEIGVAEELIDIFLGNPRQKDYHVWVAELEDGSVPAYVCYGPTPATEGTFDLYWIAVSPEHQGEGLGKKLLEFTEEAVIKSGGRMLIIETSSKEKYLPTQNFYLRNGYPVEARIKDFYSAGDDRLIYVKRFTNN